MHDSIINIFGYSLFFPATAKQLILSGMLGFIIGLDREKRGKAASIKTFSMICTGSCLFTILSIEAAVGLDPKTYDGTRIAAQMVSGLGFLGGGVIFKHDNKIEGVTTAALIWLTAAIGMACGFNRIALVLWAFIVGATIHTMADFVHRMIFAIRYRKRKRREAIENAN